MGSYSRIVTHDDFDGVVSAALAGYFLEIEAFVFAGPGEITNSKVSTTETDVVCDLPYPLVCGLWFDHHQANLEEVVLRGLDLSAIPGARSEAPSCARVIRDYFAGEFEIDPEVEEMVEAADRIDSFLYESIEDWRRETPGSVIDGAIKLKDEKPARRREFLKELTLLLMEKTLGEVAAYPEVAGRQKRFAGQEERMIGLISQNLDWLDSGRRIVLLDLTGFNRRVSVVKNLAQVLAPEAEAVLEVSCLFDGRDKTNDLSFSMSLTIEGTRSHPGQDLGEIMRSLNLGSGHPGAASGTLRSGSKEEMLRGKKRTLDLILEQWNRQARKDA